jgi:nitroreductase
VSTNRNATTDLWEALYTQRAIRYFKPDPVPPDLLWKVIEAATRAPSGSNLQPWGFVIIQEPAARRRIADQLRAVTASGARPSPAAGVSAEPADRSARLMMAGATHLMAQLDSAPVFIVPCLHRVRSPVREGLLAGSSIFQAVQNLLLAARGLGLGAAMTTFQHRLEPEFSAWLQLPEETTPVALIPLGYPDADFGPVRRRPVEEVTFWETWGATRSRT